MEHHTFVFWGKRFLLAGLILAVLSGCSGLSFGPTPEPITLKFSYFKNAADYDTLAAEYHRQHPNITIELHPVDHGYNGGQLLTSEAENMDAIRIPLTMFPENLANDFLPLDMLISSERIFRRTTCIRAAWMD